MLSGARAAICLALATPVAAMPHGGSGLVSHRGHGRGSSWCFGAPLFGEDRGSFSSAKLDEARVELGVSHGAELRGAYRDVTLWVESSRSQVHHCTPFDDHHHGNDGLWIIEFDDAETMRSETERARLLGVPVLLEHKLTIVVGGGETTSDTLGYDACGMEEDKRFISVPSHGVRGPRAMDPLVKAKYMQLATDKSNKNMDLLQLVSQENLVSMITHMENYWSRNSFSADGPEGEQGLNQAADWYTRRM